MRGTTLPLNRSEHLYWAGDGLFGPINQPYVLRFNGPVVAARVRAALRELTRAHPRLRAVVEAGLVRHHLRILPDDAHVDLLFAHAFRVEPGIDPSNEEALRARQNALLNEPMPLERGLPWCARFLPHPERPALILSIHHIVGDGRSMVQWITALLGHLHGHAIAEVPVESPSMLPAVLPQRWRDWPGSLLGWWHLSRQTRQLRRSHRLVQLPGRSQAGSGQDFSPAHIHHHVLAASSAELRALARSLNTTTNTLLTAVLARTFLARAADDPRACAAIRISVDLRRFFPAGQAPRFGNHVATFITHATHQPGIADHVRALDAQAKAGLAHFAARTEALPLLLYEWLPWVGRTLYSRLLRQAKQSGALNDVSAHFTNLGSVEAIYPEGQTGLLDALWPATAATGLLVIGLSLNGRQMLCVVHPEGDIPPAQVRAFLAEVDAELASLLGAAQAGPGGDTAPLAQAA